MSETIDPITWLKDSVAVKRRIDLNPQTNELELENSSVRLPKDAPTAWQRKDGKGYYTIGSLWLVVQMKDQRQGDYSREANKLGIPIVDFRDKRDTLDYFSGSVNESAQIDTAKRAQTLIKKSDIRQGKATIDGQGQVRKRDVKAADKLTEAQSKVIADKELSVTDYLALNEKATNGRAMVLQCRKKNFLKVLQLGYQLVQRFDEAEKIKERIEHRGAIAKEVNLDVQIFRPQHRLNLLDTILQANRSRHQTNDFGVTPHPVIIVPAMLVAGNVSLANIKSFLEDGNYAENPADSAQVLQPTQMVTVTRKIGNKNVTFDVYDSVTNFTESRWTRVVACFVNGQDWQFKEWKNGDSKRELFARVRGYYIHYANTQVPPILNSWNIKRLELQRHKRHHDVNIRNNFWSDIEDFLRREKFQGCDF